MSGTPSPDLAVLRGLWRAARPPRTLVHLDSAAAGRASWGVLDAVAAHARAEAERGGYVAAADVAGVLDDARSHLLRLLGWEGGTVVFTHSATDALTRVLTAPGTSVVAHPRGEYGPNLGVLAGSGARAVPLDTEHRLIPEALRRSLSAARDRPDAVHLTWLGSHVGTVQDVPGLTAACHEVDLPVVVDAAQALGHVDTRTTGAARPDVVYGTSRKWLAGPRGVGFVAVRGEFAQRWSDHLSRWDATEATVAGRVGFATALAEHAALGPERVRAGLAAVGSRTRAQLADGLPAGWRVVEPVEEPSATTTLLAPDDAAPDVADLARVRQRLLADHGVLTTCCGTERAPGEMTRPVLRLSGHLDTGEEDVAAFLAGLRAVVQ